MPHHFFPIPLADWKLLFNESELNYVEYKTLESLTIHLWSELSQKQQIIPNSEHANGVFARDNCPKMHSDIEFF